MSDHRLGVNYGFDRVRFPAPLPAGARVRATLEVTGVRQLDDDGWWELAQRFVVDTENGGKPVCVADSLVRVLV